MPQVFKTRRNILRAANKSKREHFTQETGLKALDDHIDGLTKKLNNLKTEKGNFLADTSPNKLETTNALKETIGDIITFINETLVDTPTYNITSVGSLPTETDDLLASAEEMIKTVKNILIVLNNKKIAELNNDIKKLNDEIGSWKQVDDEWEKMMDNIYSSKDLSDDEKSDQEKAITLKWREEGLRLPQLEDELREKYPSLLSDVAESAVRYGVRKSTTQPILKRLKDEKEKVEEQNKTLEPVAVLTEPQPDDQQPENDELPAPAPIKKFQDQWGSVVGSEGIQTCEQLNKARQQLFGMGSVNCGESFQQAPKEFPNSKKKDEDFTQDFEVLMSQLETTIGSLIQATGSQGSYVKDRNMQLGSLGTKIGEVIEGDTEFIGSMSDSIKAAGTVISDRIGQLERLKTDFDKIRGSNVWKNNLKI